MTPSLADHLLCQEAIGDVEDLRPYDVTPDTPHPLHPKTQWVKQTSVGNKVVSTVTHREVPKVAYGASGARRSPRWIWNTVVITRDKHYDKERTDYSFSAAMRWHDRMVRHLTGDAADPPIPV